MRCVLSASSNPLGAIENWQSIPVTPISVLNDIAVDAMAPRLFQFLLRFC